MVRFIIDYGKYYFIDFMAFTFQYGQIYYNIKIIFKMTKRKIYIPIWLDLLQIIQIQHNKNNKNLHSNMVRFII